MRGILVTFAAFAAFTAQPVAAGPLVCDVIEQGARPGDDVADTAAFQKAIDACSDRGGRVHVPAGRFRLGQLRLGSAMEFHLSPGAVLEASTMLDDFPPIASMNGTRAFLFGSGVRDLSITGMGTIDGQGPVWWKAIRLPSYRDTELATDADERRFRFGLVLHGCSNVRIRDLTIRETPMFLMGISECENVVIDGVTLTAPADSPNTDGLQVIDSSDIRVSNCRIAVGDDGIVMKARRRFVERLQVNNCHIQSDDGAIKFGTRSQTGVRDSLFSNIVIDQSRYGIALFMIHGGVYENNRFDNIRIINGGRHARHYPIYVDIDDRGGLGMIKGLTFDGLDITTSGNILIGGHPKAPVSDVTLSNIRMRIVDAQDLPKTAGKPRGNRSYRPVPGSPDHSGVNAHIVLGHVSGARLNGIDVAGASRPLVATPGSTSIRQDGVR